MNKLIAKQTKEVQLELIRQIAKKIPSERSKQILKRKGYNSIEEIPNIPEAKKLVNIFLYEYEKQREQGKNDLKCCRCGEEITQKIMDWTLGEYSLPLCWKCQGKQRVKNGKYQKNSNANPSSKSYED